MILAEETGNDVRAIKFAEKEIARMNEQIQHASKQQESLNKDIKKGAIICVACGACAILSGDYFIEAMQQPMINNLAEKLSSGAIFKISTLGTIFTGYYKIHKNVKDKNRLKNETAQNNYGINEMQYKKNHIIKKIIKDYEHMY